MPPNDDRNEIFKGALLLALLVILLWHYFAAVEEVLTPLFLAFAIAVVAFTMRVRWARGAALFVAALATLWFVNQIWQLLFPFVAAFFVAYLTSPIVSALEKRRIPRGLSSFLLIIFALGVFAAAVFVVVPPVVRQMTNLIVGLANLPGQLARFLAEANARLAALDQYEISPYAQTFFDSLAPRTQELFGHLFERLLRVVTSFSSLATHLVNIIITPIVTFYLLRDMPKIKNWVRERIPVRYRDEAEDIYRDIDRILAGFVRGQFIVSTLEASFVAAGLTLIGVDYALLLGIFAGFANMIPYVGTYLGALPALVVILLGPDPARQALWAFFLFVGVNVLDGYILAPRIVGRRVGLHPVAAMIAMLVGAKFFGVVGFLAAVPVTGSLRILGLHLERRYFGSAIYNDADGPERSAPPPKRAPARTPGGARRIRRTTVGGGRQAK